MRFKLNENILTEAYDESMPQVIKDWLGKRNQYKRKLMDGYGIDLGKAKFEEYPKPVSNRDPIFKDSTKIVFFDLVPDTGWRRGSHQLYAKGLNDDEQFYTDNNGNWISNKYLSAKKLMHDSEHIYYIDLTDPNNLVLDKRKTRDAYNLAHDPNRRFNKKDLIDNSWSYNRGRRNNASRDPQGIKRQLPADFAGSSGREMAAKIDKSGYFADPEKYQKKMIELGMFNYASKLDKLFDELMGTKNLIINSLSNIDERDLAGDRIVFRSFNNAINRIGNALDNYQSLDRLLKEYDSQREAGRISNEDYARVVKNSLDSYIPSVQKDTQRAKEEFNDYISAVIDWDTDDYIDDED